MACAPATVLALLLNYLASSEGVLSPPLNLSLELLDFKALVRWLPGPGNPKETRYFLEFIDIVNLSASPWYQASDCTNITSTQCYLFLNQRILNEYFVRVMAEWKEERSNWTGLPRSIQPYGYTVLSAPDLNVSAETHSISISVSHPVQSHNEVRMGFYIDLFQVSNNAAKHVAYNKTRRFHRFVDLPSGNYCISASAFITEGSKSNNNATMCIFLHHDHKAEGKAHVVLAGVLLLMCIPAAIGLILIYFYVNPISIGYIPKALGIIEETRNWALTLTSEEFSTIPLSWLFTNPTHQETDEISTQGYEAIEGNIDPDLENPYFYSTAANLEETDEFPTHRGSSKNLPSAAYDRTQSPEKCPFAFDCETSYFDSWFALSDTSEEETNSTHSDSDLGQHYEPRPDPRVSAGCPF